MTLLVVEHLGKSFGAHRAVDDLSFAVNAGELVALIGPNGAGKSTCFNMLSGQLPPDSGTIRLQDRSLLGLAPHRLARLGLGRTFQIAATFASMTVRENIAMAMLLRYRLSWKISRAAVQATLDNVGIAALAERICGELAYGDVKRVELAMAIASHPRLLLMDEPTAGMAADERAALMALIVRLARQQQMGVLFTEHDVDVVFGHADRVLAILSGHLIAEGPPEQLSRDPRLIETYLGGKKAVSPGSVPV